MNNLLSTHLPEVIDVLKSNKVKRAYAFGSVCTENFNADSDIDFLIAFEDDLDPVVQGGLYWILEEKLQKILNRQVELVAETTLSNPYFIDSVNKTKKLIYE